MKIWASLKDWYKNSSPAKKFLFGGLIVYIVLGLMMLAMIFLIK